MRPLQGWIYADRRVLWIWLIVRLKGQMLGFSNLVSIMMWFFIGGLSGEKLFPDNPMKKKTLLETFKVKKFMKKWHLDPIFGILADPKILKKLCVFSLLLYFILYLPIYVSYDRDSFSSVLCYAWVYFRIFVLVSSDLSKFFRAV